MGANELLMRRVRELGCCQGRGQTADVDEVRQVSRKISHCNLQISELISPRQSSRGSALKVEILKTDVRCTQCALESTFSLSLSLIIFKNVARN